MAKIMELFAASLDDFTADYEKLQWDVSFRGEAYPPRIIMEQATPPLYKIEDCYRMRVVLKCRRSKRLLAMLGELLRHFTTKDYKAVSVGVDINPTNL